MKLGYVMALGGLLTLASFQQSAVADTYVIDTKGSHASINFEIPHLGYSILTGRFDKFSGTFDYDPAAPEKSKVSVEIDPASVNSNHAKRDKHIRDGDFLDVGAYPTAKFESTSVTSSGEGKANITGNLTLHGVTKEIVIKAKHIGGGKDPWGGFRHGFRGTTDLKLKDFGINFNLGPASEVVKLKLHVEGIKQ